MEQSEIGPRGLPLPKTQGRERWLEGGRALLIEGGHEAVKLHPLTDRVGLSTGSFYHHFDGISDFLIALAQSHTTDQLDEVLDAVSDVADPLERLHRFTRLSRDRNTEPLDAAFRAWAPSSPEATEALRRADSRVLEFLVDAFQDLGSPTDTARIQALLLLSVGTAHSTPPWPLPGGTRRATVELVAYGPQHKRKQHPPG